MASSIIEMSKGRRRRSGAALLPSAVMALFLAASTTPGSAAPDINGKWRTPDGATIEIADCGAAPCGKIAAFSPPPGYSLQTTRDANNKDASKRSRRILGLTVLWRLKPKDERWVGRIYDPRRGFSAEATVTRKTRDTLNLKGCVRVLFKVCEEETWRRIN
ncbi:DUF2147 domain-containing protein [uncultured Roseibium sp.]|uniref:DUF2147 domain-containing protein n=1 Tax=uncultured Roseibium sp. TaxID=1936171 RepID=UPI002597887B|nr:DUF2147 domain-containing protein [uncultured Roseibium sp.]